MRRFLLPSLSVIAILALAGAPGADAAAPPPGCTNQTTVSFLDDVSGFGPGTYSQVGPPAVSVTLSDLASQTVSFETTSPDWRVLSVQVEYIYDDEGGELGQDEVHTYGTGVTSSSFVIAEGNFVRWGTYIHLELVDCGPGTMTTVAPTTVAPTTVAPTTVVPTTVAPTTAAPTTATPTTARPAAAAPAPASGTLPSTGSNDNLAWFAALAVLGGAALILVSRRGSVGPG